MSDLYKSMAYIVHSYLETNRKKVIVDNSSTVENFREEKQNNKFCNEIFDHVLLHHNYELSYNQMANGINLFLKSCKQNNYVG